MRARARAMTLAVATATAAVTTATTATAAVPTDTTALRDAVTVEAMMDHLEALQAIADANDDTRASGTPGYDQSADYVADLLTQAGYDVSRQPFDYQVFFETADAELDQVAPNPTTYILGEDFVTMEYSGSGDVTAQLVPTNDILIPPPATPGSTSGCEASDFPAETLGNIALIQRGTCTFRQKVENAQAAGAVGVILFNEGQEGRTEVLNGTLSPPQLAIPAVGTTFDLGAELYALTQAGPVTMHVAVTATAETRTTENVIAETTTGRTDRVVMAGAHLDSVLEGPGINDNGSGSAAILETALQMAELGIEPRNQVRFAFWGAEESGLIGSQFYVDSLTKREIKDIALYLNFDMVASPNFVRFVYDGNGSAFGIKGPTGSAQIEDVFTDFFASQGLPTEETAFDGRSDYQGFINAGIPAGGLFTGAEGAKTPEQQAVYGGLATFNGEAVSYDPCYHQACDSLDPVADGADADLYAALNAAYGGALTHNGTIANINKLVFEQMGDAIAHAVLTYAMTTSAVPGTARASATATGQMVFKGSHLQR